MSSHSITRAIDYSEMDDLYEFILDSINHFHKLDRMDEDIRIHLPIYFNSMLMRYLQSKELYTNKYFGNKIIKFRGVDVLEGYENKIVISIKDGPLYNIEPLEIQIP